MTNPELWQQYQALLKNVDFVVTYSALSDEIPVEETPNFEIIKNKPQFIVPPTHKIEPKEVGCQALFCTKKYLTPSVIIFLPGQKFDLAGTRKGRGFGWYDKLLAELPTDWIRIGVANENQISQTPLVRNQWDQPVYWLVWKENRSWEITKTATR
jgi:hypothetical protein